MLGRLKHLNRSALCLTAAGVSVAALAGGCGSGASVQRPASQSTLPAPTSPAAVPSGISTAPSTVPGSEALARSQLAMRRAYRAARATRGPYSQGIVLTAAAAAQADRICRRLSPIRLTGLPPAGAHSQTVAAVASINANRLGAVAVALQNAASDLKSVPLAMLAGTYRQLIQTQMSLAARATGGAQARRALLADAHGLTSALRGQASSLGLSPCAPR